MKIIFFTDLDNTLIYSYKHDIGNRKRCVEIYQGREISFVTEYTHKLLKKINKEINKDGFFVPITTRTVEQYKRIHLAIGNIPLALVCNGGVLLKEGVEDENWYRESLEMTASGRTALKKAEDLLIRDENRSFEVRNIKDLFVFTKSSRPEITAARLMECLDPLVINVFRNGSKVYAVPVQLNKGNGMQRLARQLGTQISIAAGDSTFDLPMLQCADYGFAPAKLAEHIADQSSIIVVREQQLFSEGLLESVMQIIKTL